MTCIELFCKISTPHTLYLRFLWNIYTMNLLLKIYVIIVFKLKETFEVLLKGGCSNVITKTKKLPQRPWWKPLRANTRGKTSSSCKIKTRICRWEIIYNKIPIKHNCLYSLSGGWVFPSYTNFSMLAFLHSGNCYKLNKFQFVMVLWNRIYMIENCN